MEANYLHPPPVPYSLIYSLLLSTSLMLVISSKNDSLVPSRSLALLLHWFHPEWITPWLTLPAPSVFNGSPEFSPFCSSSPLASPGRPLPPDPLDPLSQGPSLELLSLQLHCGPPSFRLHQGSLSFRPHHEGPLFH